MLAGLLPEVRRLPTLPFIALSFVLAKATRPYETFSVSHSPEEKARLLAPALRMLRFFKKMFHTGYRNSRYLSRIRAMGLRFTAKNGLRKRSALSRVPDRRRGDLINPPWKLNIYGREEP